MNKHFIRLTALSLLASTSLLTGHAHAADDTPNFATDNLTGDWGGARTNLYHHGVNLDVLYRADAWRNTSGGVKTGTVGNDDLDVILTLDGEKLYGIKGSTISIYGLHNGGGHINNLVGSNGGIDNFEVENPTNQLYTAWIEQTAFDNLLSVKLGLYDLNTEFYVTDTSGLFLNPTYGIGTEMAATGLGGPSVFPAAAPAIRLIVNPTDKIYVQAALLGGTPKDPDKSLNERFQFDDKNGALDVFEAGFKDDEIGHYALGIWQYTAKSDDYTDTDAVSGDPIQRQNKGIYAMAERTLFKDSKDDTRNLAGFIRLGFADKDVSPYEWSGSVGVVYNHVFDSRADSQLGFAVSNTANSSKFREASALAGDDLDKNETQLELTYSDKLMPWLTIQPDVQYTINPGTDPDNSDALTFGIRAGIQM